MGQHPVHAGVVFSAGVGGAWGRRRLWIGGAGHGLQAGQKRSDIVHGRAPTEKSRVLACRQVAIKSIANNAIAARAGGQFCAVSCLWRLAVQQIQNPTSRRCVVTGSWYASQCPAPGTTCARRCAWPWVHWGARVCGSAVTSCSPQMPASGAVTCGRHCASELVLTMCLPRTRDRTARHQCRQFCQQDGLCGCQRRSPQSSAAGIARTTRRQFQRRPVARWPFDAVVDGTGQLCGFDALGGLHD